MKRDVPIALSQLRALVLLLLCLPLVPTALFVRMVGETDTLLDNEARAGAAPIYREQLARAAEAAAWTDAPLVAIHEARRLFGDASQVALFDAAGTLLAGSPVDDPAADYFETPVAHSGGEWTLGVWADAAPTSTGWNPFLVMAGFVTVGVLATAVVAGVTLTRQLKIQEIKSDALNAVSHELKTPLSSMRVLLETLEDDRVGDEQTRSEYVSLLMAENQRMGRVLSDFLSLARLERNRKTFRMAPVVAAQAVEGALVEARPEIEERGGRLRCYGPADGPLVEGEHTALEGVVAILLDNAIKYSTGKPDIEVLYFASGKFAYFMVKDRGLGVPRQFRRRIFDSFYQVDPALSRRGGGCGLGLSIAWHIVSAHGGTIRHCPRRGRGSVFRFSIPLAPTSAQATPAPATEPLLAAAR